MFERPDKHGEPEDSFALIASLWSDYLGIEIPAEEVPDLFMLMKIARNKEGVYCDDNAPDICGYAYHGDRLRRQK